MCLILFAIHPDPEYQLVVAANRDEFYHRPTREAIFWEDNPQILAGKDLQMGGTWLGITRTGRFAAVTNFRETPANPSPARSRGDLTLNFLRGNALATDYLANLRDVSDDYRGFNLLLGDQSGYYYYSNRSGQVTNLNSGYYGLSNQLLNCDWPKVIQGKEKLRSLADKNFCKSGMFDLLADKGNEEPFSPKFIEGADYGTRSSTLLTIKNDGSLSFEERNFIAGGVAVHNNRYDFQASGF